MEVIVKSNKPNNYVNTGYKYSNPGKRECLYKI